MKILKNTLIVSSYLLLVALFFGGGYAIGRSGVKDTATSEIMPTPEAVETTADKIESPEYELIIEEGVLKINKCIDEEKTVISSEEISESVFPREDVEELKRGVRFKRLEQAQQMFENFVS